MIVQLNNGITTEFVQFVIQPVKLVPMLILVIHAKLPTYIMVNVFQSVLMVIMLIKINVKSVTHKPTVKLAQMVKLVTLVIILSMLFMKENVLKNVQTNTMNP